MLRKSDSGNTTTATPGESVYGIDGIVARIQGLIGLNVCVCVCKTVPDPFVRMRFPGLSLNFLSGREVPAGGF